MPYIAQEARARLDGKYVFDTVHTDGELAYIITKLLLAQTRHGASYSDLAVLMGVLATVQAEFYRRRVAPYEDEKAKLNGDVFV